MGRLAGYDIFNKVDNYYTTTSTRGGVSTILLAVILFWLLATEFSTYLWGHEHYLVKIETVIEDSLPVTMDITVAMDCDLLNVDAQDASGDRIVVSEGIRLEKVASLDQRTIFFQQIVNSEADHLSMCRITGDINLNRVRGSLHITAKGRGYADSVIATTEQINFSHVITELRFGKRHKTLPHSPLEGVRYITDHNLFLYQYFISLVPTRLPHKSFTTNQYAVTESHREVPFSTVPGIFFKYDIEPLMVEIVDESMPFLVFVVRIMGIIGGILVCFRWFLQLIDVLLEYWKSRSRRVIRGTSLEGHDDHINGTKEN